MATVVRPALLGRGIYDPTEAARLIRVHPETLARWTTGRDPLIVPVFERFFDFEDLVSLLVIAELWRRHVPTDDVRVGIKALAGALDVERPLAHIDAPTQLATVGMSFFAHIGEWADAGKGFQLAFQPMIEPVLQPLEYGVHGMANLWRPVPLVTAAPAVQAGTPCVEATRIPTSTIAGLVREGEDLEDIAFDLNLEIEQIEAALRFEAAPPGSTARAQGLRSVGRCLTSKASCTAMSRCLACAYTSPKPDKGNRSSSCTRSSNTGTPGGTSFPG